MNSPKGNFQDLPPELRLQIYELALIEPRSIRINKELQHPPILTAVQNDAAEISSIFYGKNTFTYYLADAFFQEPNIQDLIDWLTNLGDEQRAFLRRVEIVTFFASSNFMSAKETRETVEEGLRCRGVELGSGVLRFVLDGGLVEFVAYCP